MSGNRKFFVIGGVLFLCLCLGLIALGAGGYFLFQRNSVSTGLNTPILIPPSTFAAPLGAPPTPRANIAPPASGDVCAAVEEFEDQGNDHIRSGSPHPAYNSNPPTSGWHWDTPKDWGIYSTPQVQEQLVHNLEHGGIVIQYNNLPAADLQRLLTFVRNDPRHIIVAPYPGLPGNAKIAWTAWTASQTCTGLDLDALTNFIDEFRDQGPEYIP